MKRLMKGLHELGAVGVLGALAACLVLILSAPADSPVGYAAVRQGIAAMTQWLLVPSLALVLVSGLIAIALNPAYMDAGWAWAKAVSGIVLFEGTLLTVAASARKAADLSALVASGAAEAAQLEAVLRTEWGGLWTIFALSVANLVVGVWRPRFMRRRVEPELGG
jgi:hypothetical protein